MATLLIHPTLQTTSPPLAISPAPPPAPVAAALESAFPGVHFQYENQALLVAVGWVDGPTVAEVQAVLAPLAEELHRFLVPTRQYSRRFLMGIAAQVATEYACDPPAVYMAGWGAYLADSAYNVPVAYTPQGETDRLVLRPGTTLLPIRNRVSLGGLIMDRACNTTGAGLRHHSAD